MRRFLCLWWMLSACAVHAADPPPDPGKARIRVAGVFIAGFNVWKTAIPACAADGKPWLKLECGLIKCPKPKWLGIPLDLDYTNWRQSPRVTEVEIETGKPLTLHLSGTFVRGLSATTARLSTCAFDASFTPSAGAMYEVTLDPTEDAMFGANAASPAGGRCKLRLSEIRPSDTGIHHRHPVDGAQIRNCVR